MIFKEKPELVEPATVKDLYEGKDIFKSVYQQYIDVWSYFDSLTEEKTLTLEAIDNDKSINYLENFIGRYVLSARIDDIYGETPSRHHYRFNGEIGKLYKNENNGEIDLRRQFPGGTGTTSNPFQGVDFVSLIDGDLYKTLYKTKLFFTDNFSTGLYPYKGFPLHPSPSDKSLICLSKKFIGKINTWQTDWDTDMKGRRIF